MDAFIHATAATPRNPRVANLRTTHGWHFCSTVLPSRTRRNSLKTKGGVSFYPSQKPEGRMPARWQNYRAKTKRLRLDNAESVHIRYLFVLLP